MAETSAEPQDIHTPEVLFNGAAEEPQPAETVKRPVGRPRNDGKPAGSLNKAPAGPAPGEEGGTETDFFAWLKSLPRADWDEQLFMYLYRTAPQINMGRKGEWRLERYARPVDAQEIMETHGSGGYKIILDRWNPTTNQTTIVRLHYFVIVNMHYPPKVPLGTWLDKPENKDWLWAKPALEKQIAGTAGAPGNDAALFQAAVNAVKELRPDVSNEDQTTLTKLVIDTMRDGQREMLARSDPSSTLQLVNTIVGAISGKGEQAAGGVMQLVTAQIEGMRAELAAERAFSRDLLNKLMTPPAAGEKKGVKSELTEILEVARELGFSRGGAAKTDWGEVAVETGKELLKSLTVLGTAIITKTPAKPATPANPRQPVTVEARAEIAAPAAAPASQQHEPAAEGDSEAMNLIQTISNQFGGLFDTATPFLVDQFVKGFTGMEFREWFQETYGTYTMNTIRGMDPRTIYAVLELRKRDAPEHVSALLQQLQPEERVMEFITEFLSDEPVPGEEDDEPEPAPAPAPRRPVEIRKQPDRTRTAPTERPDRSPAAATFTEPNHGEF